MSFLRLNIASVRSQYLISLGVVAVVALVCFGLQSWLGYKAIALLLLMSVSVLAMRFEILPVLIASGASALVWNFFFIPPVFTFHIHNTEDMLMFFMYFVLALVHTVLTFKIKEQAQKARDKEDKENAIRLYNTLLNSLSHELRTPIAAIIGTIDTLQNFGESLSASQQQALLAEIETASLRLNREVENLLNINRLETGILRLHKDWCDPNELIYSTIATFDAAQQNRIAFQSNENLPLCKLDVGVIQQVMYNLIHNALRYAPPDTRVSITALAQQNTCIFSVSDAGKGIAEAEQSRIFDKFYRIAHTPAGGIGLGLSIAKGFVEAHGGKLSVANNAEGGATFTVTLFTETSHFNQLKNE